MNLLGLGWSGWGQGPMAGSWKIIMNLLIPSNVVNFLTSGTAINFCRGTLLAGVVCVSCLVLIQFMKSTFWIEGCWTLLSHEYHNWVFFIMYWLPWGFTWLCQSVCAEMSPENLKIGRNHNLHLPTLWSSTVWKLVKSSDSKCCSEL